VNTVKIYLADRCWEDVDWTGLDWTNLVQDTDKQRALVAATMTIRIP
jgi:hypothetical protein